MENPAILLRRLNPYCARAMEGAASLCQTRAHAEILPEHWLLKLFEQGEGDLTVLARRYEWDMDSIWQDLLGWLDKQPRSVRHRPQLSDNIQSLMQEAWLIASLNGEEQIRSHHLLMALVEKQNLVRCDGLWPLLTLGQSQLERLRPLLDAQSDERPQVQQEAELAQRHGGEVEFVVRPAGEDVKEGELNPALQNALDKFTLDVTAKAREGKIDPVFGRDTEIRQMVDILSRRRKNNPILVGEPGVGKTALVEGLGLRIAEGNVPESLKPVILRTLDLGLLQAGAGVKGEFEQRLKNVIDAVQQSPVPILLFIDEAHTIIGAGNQAGGADAANLLKPALARGELRTIAATTWSEYKQYFERDAALERRFQRVKVDEPDDDTACLMLRGLKSRYAEHHNVHITNDAVRAAVTLATYYCWARLHQDGETGFAEGLELLAGLLQRYGTQLHPQRERSRKPALEWLAGSRVLDSLSLWPEVVREDAQRTAGALLLISDCLETEPEVSRPGLNALYNALESRLIKAGGVDAVVPQNVGHKAQASYTTEADAPVLSRITSGQDLLAQARTLTGYLREQPDGWLAAHRLMKSLRHDTLSAIPAPDAEGKTRIEPPRADQRAMLKRLYLQQSWLEILEQADSTFSRGANHLWLDLQWYVHQALMKSGQDVLADIIAADLKGLLRRLTGLETLAFNDGTPFADEVTLNWINQNVLDDMAGWRDEPVSADSGDNNDILALEPEALEKADTDGLDATLHWLQTRPGTDATKDKWLLRLLMARVAEQKGKNELALHLLGELDSAAQSITLTQWTPALLFEVKSRRLRLLRIKATRSETDKSRLQPEMDLLLSGLIALDPASSAVLCG